MRRCGSACGVAVLTGGLIALLHALAVGHLPGRPDHLRRGDQPPRPRAHRLPPLRGDRRPTGISTGRAHRRHRAPAAVRHPDRRRRSCSPNKPIFFVDVRRRRAHRLGALPHARSACGCGRSARTRTRPRRSASTPIRIRYRAVVIGGLIAGLAGAWFSLESQAGFQDNMTNGTGFIALAALIFGKWRPWHRVRRRHALRLHPGARRPAADPAGDDRRLLDPERVPAVAAVRRDDHRGGRRRRPGHRPRPPTASPTSARDDRDRRLGSARGRGRRGLQPAPTRRTRTTRSAWPGSSTTAACSPRATSRTRPTASRCARSAGSCPRSTPPAAAAWWRWPASTGGAEPLVPCGRCRQLLHEHGGPELLFNERPLGELLPDAFGPEHLPGRLMATLRFAPGRRASAGEAGPSGLNDRDAST